VLLLGIGVLVGSVDIVLILTIGAALVRLIKDAP
jgi:hypothetical protein